METRAKLMALVIAVVGLGTFGSARAAGPTFEELKAKGALALLEHADKLANHYPTQIWVTKMTVKKANEEPKHLKFKVWQKGSKRLFRFLEPGNVKGTSILIRGAKSMHVYSPETMKVRKVATHARRQTVLGSNYTMDDMATVDFSEAYDPKIDKEEGQYIWLELTRKPGAVASWPKLRLRIDSKTLMHDRTEYWEDGTKKRVEKRSNWKVWDGTPTYRKLAMTTFATKLTTTLELLSQTIGSDISDSFFKTRNLVRGN